MSIEKKLVVAVVGVGRWGQNLLRQFDALAEVKYVFHKGSPKAQSFLADKYPHVKVALLYEAILNDKSVQAVVIATPTSTHFDLAMRALKAGKHVFLEKPGTDSYDKLEELCAEADRRNLKLAIGYVFVHHPACQKIIELVFNKDNQSKKEIRFKWCKRGTFGNHPLENLASHHLAILHQWRLLPAKIINGRSSFVVSDEPDIIDIDLEKDGNSIKIEIDRVSPHTNHTCLVLAGPDSYIWYGDTLNRIIPPTEKPSEIFEPVYLEETTALTAEIKNFLAAVRDSETLLVDGRFGLEVWQQMNKIYSTL